MTSLPIIMAQNFPLGIFIVNASLIIAVYLISESESSFVTGSKPTSNDVQLY